jgi:Xaa-Pro dipeptidase
MLALCSRHLGLATSLTRLIRFGPIPDDPRSHLNAVTQVDAAMIAAASPGQSFPDVFDVAVDARQALAHAGHHPHRDTMAGYEPREVMARLGTADRAAAGQVIARNPSLPGAKSEDTILFRQADN